MALLVASALIAAARIDAATGPELVVNGGFETGDFTGWTVTPASMGSDFGVDNTAPHTGSFEASFGGTAIGFFDSISQTIPTVPGALYRVSFWLQNDGTGVQEFLAEFNGNTLDDFSPHFPYTQFVYPKVFLDGTDHADAHYTVATSTSAVLRLRGYNLPSFWRLDDVSVMRVCDPLQTGSQQFFDATLPLAIPKGRNGGDVAFQFLTGTGSIFQSEPQSTSASLYVCLDDVLPQNLKIIISPGGNNSTQIVVWDHEQFLDSNNQPITHIEALANIPSVAPFQDAGSNPPTFSYKIQVLDDEPGRIFDNGQFIYIGTVNSSVLTLNPSNPGHFGMPIVSLYSDEMFHLIPLSIQFGDPLTVFATAIGNPSSFKIARLGLRVVERVDINPLNPDPNHLLPTPQQHNTGTGPGIFIQDDVAQSPSSTTGVGSHFDPPDLPILPPGYYEVTATAWDSAGFTRSLTQHLTVNRSFGFLSVANLVRQVNTNCDETIDGFPCNTTNFSATLNLINNTPIDSGNLRIRLVDIPGSAFLDSADFLPPTAERDFLPSEIMAGPVTPLPGCSAEQVQVCGVIPQPNQSTSDFGVGHQVYAVLEECDATQVQCADPNNADLWIPVDTIRVTEGEWPVVAGFNGPGGGSNQDRHGGKDKNNPFLLDSIAITGPTTVASSGSAQYHSNATLKNSQGTTKQLTNVKVKWSASMFSISSAGLFQAGAVTANTPVMITASYTLAGVTKTQTVQITVNAPMMAQSAPVSQAVIPETGDENTDQDSLGQEGETDMVSPQKKSKPKPPKPPNVTLSVSPTSVTEGNGANVMVSINKANPTQSIDIKYSLSGTALLNTHFAICGEPGTITIPAGATTATARLTAIANDLNLGTESVTISLTPNSAYKLPKKGAKATVNITNVPPPLCP
jgi:hypothetical protein